MQINNNKYSQYVFFLYASYLVILWTFVNYGSSGNSPYAANDYRWYLITISFFVFLFLIIPTIKFSTISLSQLFLLSYLISIAVSSVLRLDPKHFYEAMKLALPLWFLFQNRPSISVKTLNVLYVIVLVGGILMYNVDSGDFGFLPGQATVNLHQGLWWRISIWNYKTPPYSAALSILVFFINIHQNNSKTKYLFCIIALYFIAFSGSRTGYLIFLVGIFIFLLEKKITFKYRKIYMVLPLAFFIFIFMLQILSSLLVVLNIENSILTSLFLRSSSSTSDVSNLSSRLLIMGEHISLFKQSVNFPIFGIGSDIYNSTNWTDNGGFLGGSTDSFLSHMLIRDGVAFLFLIGVFLNQFYLSMVKRNVVTYSLLTFLMLYCIGYGAWLNFTSPVFVLYCCYLFSVKKDKSMDVI